MLKRKLCALALCILLTVSQPQVLDRLVQILRYVTTSQCSCRVLSYKYAVATALPHIYPSLVGSVLVLKRVCWKSIVQICCSVHWPSCVVQIGLRFFSKGIEYFEHRGNKSVAKVEHRERLHTRIKGLAVSTCLE
jgi:hypothetical protein